MPHKSGHRSLVVRICSVLRDGSGQEIQRHHQPHHTQVRLFWDSNCRLLGPFLRKEEEHKLTGTFLFLIGSLCAATVYPRVISILGVLYLAFGDPAASIVGGQLELPYCRLSSGKSIHGTLAAVAVCTWITYSSLHLSINEPNLHQDALFWITIIGGLVGGISELIPLGVDDNISIPIISGLVLSVAFKYWGINADALSLCLGCSYNAL